MPSYFKLRNGTFSNGCMATATLSYFSVLPVINTLFQPYFDIFSYIYML
jgi:hypothetical protein